MGGRASVFERDRVGAPFVRARGVFRTVRTRRRDPFRRPLLPRDSDARRLRLRYPLKTPDLARSFGAPTRPPRRLATRRRARSRRLARRNRPRPRRPNRLHRRAVGLPFAGNARPPRPRLRAVSDRYRGAP